jgi:hypothetical protein
MVFAGSSLLVSHTFMDSPSQRQALSCGEVPACWGKETTKARKALISGTSPTNCWLTSSSARSFFVIALLSGSAPDQDEPEHQHQDQRSTSPEHLLLPLYFRERF